MNPILKHNQKAWDQRVDRHRPHTRPAEDNLFPKARELTDIFGWIGRDLTGLRVLCLGAGGGRHGPLYAAAGGQVTVVDLSPRMLEQDRLVAKKRRLNIQTVEASMDDMSSLGGGTFDLVIHPVSTCYVPDIVKVYAEVARVMKPGGLYVSQHKQPACLQASFKPREGHYWIEVPYYRKGALPTAPIDHGHREAACLEFMHRWEDLLGGLCRSGFVIEDIKEPFHGDPKADPGSFEHRCNYFPPFISIKARRAEGAGRTVHEVGEGSLLWTP